MILGACNAESLLHDNFFNFTLLGGRAVNVRMCDVMRVFNDIKTFMSELICKTKMEFVFN